MKVTFDKKGTILDRESGEEIINIASSPIISVDAINETYAFAVSCDDYGGRIDKFCSDKILPSGYDSSSIDSVMYLNEIINPFAFCGDEKTIVFGCSYSDSAYSKEDAVAYPDHSTSKEVEEFKDKTNEVTNKLKAKPDTNRKNRLQRLAQSRSNGVKEVTTSNMIQPGQVAKIYKNGKVILGGNIIQTK